MRSVKIETLISLSITRTKVILFKPFSLKKWLVLLFIAYMAGALGGGSGPNFNAGGGGGGSYDKKADAAVIEAQAYGQDIESEALGEEGDEAMSFLAAAVASGIILGMVVFGIALLLLFMWLAARFKFIWYHSIVNNDASIKAPFRQYAKEGNSLFKFFVVLLFLFLAFIGILGGWVYLSGSAEGLFEEGAQWAFGTALKVFAIPVILFVGGVIAMSIITVCVDHFVMVIMAMKNLRFRQAWAEFARIAKENLKDFCIYILLLMALGIAAGVISFLIWLACLVVVLLAAGILFGIPYLLIVAAFKLKVVFVIYAVILGIPFLLAAILLFLSVGLPFAAFFRNFSLYFLSSLNCGYLPLSFVDDPAEGPAPS